MTTLDLTQFPVHTSLATSDLERAKTWYSDKLGLTPDQENGGVWYRFAGETWLHVYQTSAAGTAQNTVAGITVTNIEEVIEQLRQHGVEFEDYEVTENGLATFETAKVAWFRDPDGNTIELSETLT